jgi:hypothetical protein
MGFEQLILHVVHDETRRFNLKTAVDDGESPQRSRAATKEKSGNHE